MSDEQTVTVPVECTLTITTTVTVIVEVEQTGDVKPGHSDWPDVPALIEAATAKVLAGDESMKAQNRLVTFQRWQIAPSKEGEPWRPVMFGGRL